MLTERLSLMLSNLQRLRIMHLEKSLVLQVPEVKRLQEKAKTSIPVT